MKTILVRLFNLFSRKESITLVFVFIISLLLRINLAVKLPIWIDEAIVLNLSQNNNFYNLLSGNHWDASHPPLLHIITKLQLFLINEKHIFLYSFVTRFNELQQFNINF